METQVLDLDKKYWFGAPKREKAQRMYEVIILRSESKFLVEFQEIKDTNIKKK